jgi:transcriptional regulator with XRE-family HTH domain
LSSIKLPEVISLSHRVRVAREAARLKKIDLARETGLSLSYIGRIENGKSRPSRVALQALAVALSVHSDWLIAGKGEMMTTTRGGITRESGLTGELDVERYLVGTPLEGAFSRVPRSIRQRWRTAWQEFPGHRQAEVRRTVTTFTNAAVVLNQLPRELAKPLFSQFEKQLRTYAADVFASPPRRG